MCITPLYRLPAVAPSYSTALLSPLTEGPGLVVKQEGLVVSRAVRDDLIRNGKSIKQDFQEIPCRRCIECRLAYARNWAMRIVHEASLYKDNYFITLTYDDDHLPTRTIFNDPLALARSDLSSDLHWESQTVGVLESDAISKFMKRLRSLMRREGIKSDGIRFYGCGEYGDQYKRPHYHIILFNCPLPDIYYVGKSSRGKSMYSSRLIERAWTDCDPSFKQLVGRVVVEEVTYDSAAYVAGYALKKVKGRESEKAKLEFICDQINEDGDLSRLSRFAKFVTWSGGTVSNTVPDQFSRMSRRPGIGYEFAKANPHMYETDSVNIKSGNKLVSLKPCAYYDNLYDVEDPMMMELVKRRRQLSAVSRQKLKFEAYSGLSDEDIQQQRIDRVRRKYKVNRDF